MPIAARRDRHRTGARWQQPLHGPAGRDAAQQPVPRRADDEDRRADLVGEVGEVGEDRRDRAGPERRELRFRRCPSPSPMSYEPARTGQARSCAPEEANEGGRGATAARPRP